MTKTFCSVIKKGDIFAPLFQRLTDLTEEVNSLSCLTSLYVSGVQVEFQKWLEKVKSFFFLRMNILSFYWLHKIFSAAVSLSIQDEFSMRYWHILKWLNDSHVRQWDHHVDDRSIKSNFSVPFRVAKQSRRSHVKRDQVNPLTLWFRVIANENCHQTLRLRCWPFNAFPVLRKLFAF